MSEQSEIGAVSLVDSTAGRTKDFVPCRVCGKRVGSPTQHRRDKHPEVTDKAWRALGEWKPAAPSSLPPVAGEPVAAPWPDHLGQPIHHGDRLSHPDGTEFTAIRLHGHADESDAWRGVYDDATVRRLVLQINDKGRAFLVERTASKGEGVQSDDGALGEVECECCQGVGTIDMRLGGEWNSNPAATCPDCDGAGKWTPRAALGENSGSVLSDHSPPSEASKARELVERLRRLSPGRVEWRVANPANGNYCMSFDLEHDARKWLDDHRAMHPKSQFADYEVTRVHYFDAVERAALEAAELLASSTAAGAKKPNSPIPESSAGVREALSDEEIDAIAKAQDDDPAEPWFTRQLTRLEWRYFARAIEAAHGIKQGATP